MRPKKGSVTLPFFRLRGRNVNRFTNDKVVTVTYRVDDEKGEVLEQIDLLPVNYVHGRDSGLVEKVEQALEGKTVGREVAVPLMPADGFGESDLFRRYRKRSAAIPAAWHRGRVRQ